MEKELHGNSNNKRVGVATIISDKVDLKTHQKSITMDKGVFYN